MWRKGCTHGRRVCGLRCTHTRIYKRHCGGSGHNASDVENAERKRVRKKHKDILAIQRKIFQQAGHDLGIKTYDGWYSVQRQDASDMVGASILNKYNKCLSTALHTVFPEYCWQDWRFSRAPMGFWLKVSNQKAFIDSVGCALNVKTLDEWYRIASHQLVDHGASGMMMEKYSHSVSRMVKTLFPQFKWNIKKFIYCPRRLWDNNKRQLHVLDSMSKAHNIKICEDWYAKCHTVKLSQNERYIIKKYNNQLKNAVMEIFSNYEWMPWRFERVDVGHWNGVDGLSNQQERFDDLGRLLGVKRMDDWYNVRLVDFKLVGGSTLLRINGSSLATALLKVYKDYTWNLNSFEVKRSLYPVGYWKEKKNVKTFFTKVENSLNITNPWDWYNVSVAQITQLSGGGGCSVFPKALQWVYPEVKWNWHLFTVPFKKACQWQLVQCVKSLFPSHVVEEEHCIGYREDNSVALTVDVFIPHFNLAIEYQGEQHYQDDVPYALPSIVYFNRDTEKMSLCLQYGITLVSVPYWWRGDVDTLAATLIQHLPKLKLELPHHVQALAPTNYTLGSTNAIMSPVATLSV